MARKMVLNETAYHGPGAIKEIVPEVKKRGFEKALVCSDNNLLGFGLVDKLTGLLYDADVPFSIFSDIHSNPSVEDVQNGVYAFKEAEADFIIAVGGGSVIDVAKAIGIIINNPDFSDVTSLEGEADTQYPSVPVIAVPTTAGTAAEVTMNYVITNPRTHRKMVCIDPHAVPAVAVVDPDMMASMPNMLTAATGMDALTHAIEGYITNNAWPMTDCLHLKAIELIAQNLRDAVRDDPGAIENMAMAQYMAGMGFSNAGLGLVHAMAHPLGALYDTPHGMANAILLPTIMLYNASAAGEKYRDIAKAMGVEGTDDMSEEEYRREAVGAVILLSQDIGIPGDLIGVVRREDVSFLAQSAYEDVCCTGNPRNASVEEIQSLYHSLL